MNTDALNNDALLPQRPGGHAPGAVMAVLVHLGLIAALTLGVDWRVREPDVVSAELWAAVPQMAAPPPLPDVTPAPAPAPAPTPTPVPPPPVPRAEKPPPPREADIALEQERRRKLEAERNKAEQAADLADKKARDKAVQQADAERKKAEQQAKDKQAATDKQAAADKQAAKEKLADAEQKKRDAERVAREKADDERLARQREDNLRRMRDQAGGTTGATAATGTAAQTAAPSASYAGKVKAAVRPNIVFTGNVAGGAAAEVEVNAAPGGSIISRRLSRSSGNTDWDEAVLRAIDKTQAMPRDTDGRVPAALIISFRPNE